MIIIIVSIILYIMASILLFKQKKFEKIVSNIDGVDILHPKWYWITTWGIYILSLIGFCVISPIIFVVAIFTIGLIAMIENALEWARP
jgi:hypothetical protein